MAVLMPLMDGIKDVLTCVILFIVICALCLLYDSVPKGNHRCASELYSQTTYKEWNFHDIVWCCHRRRLMKTHTYSPIGFRFAGHMNAVVQRIQIIWYWIQTMATYLFFPMVWTNTQVYTLPPNSIPDYYTHIQFTDSQSTEDVELARGESPHVNQLCVFCVVYHDGFSPIERCLGWWHWWRPISTINNDIVFRGSEEMLWQSDLTEWCVRCATEEGGRFQIGLTVQCIQCIWSHRKNKWIRINYCEL